MGCGLPAQRVEVPIPPCGSLHDGAKYCQVPRAQVLGPSLAETGASCCLSVTTGLAYQLRKAGGGGGQPKWLQLWHGIAGLRFRLDHASAKTSAAAQGSMLCWIWVSCPS